MRRVFVPLGLALALQFALDGFAANDVPLEWIRRHQASEHRGSTSKAIAAGQAGVIFVAGTVPNDRFGGFDVEIVAYSGAGVPLWTNRFDGGFDDGAQSAQVGPQGTVYVLGSSSDGAHGYDMTLLAYSSEGHPLWTKWFDGRGHGLDSAQALAIDESTGNIVATGSSTDASGDSEYATVAYSPQGVCLWTNYYRASEPGNSLSQDVGVDAQTGNVYVTGFSPGQGTHQDYLTLAYSRFGVPLWTNRFDGLAHGEDFAMGLVTDGLGRVYVTGTATGNRFRDYATVAYDRDGAAMWTNWFDGSVNYHEEALGIAMGQDHRIYVTGVSGGFASECVTIAYTAEGTALWTNRLDSAFRPACLAVDDRGVVFVSGSHLGDCMTLSYSPSGAILWTHAYSGEGESYDEVKAMILDAQGNLFVTGTVAAGLVRSAWTTLKYSPRAMRLVDPRAGIAGFQFNIYPGREGGYRIETSQDLVEWGLWTNVNVSNTTIQLLDGTFTNGTRRFYRALWTPR